MGNVKSLSPWAFCGSEKVPGVSLETFGNPENTETQKMSVLVIRTNYEAVKLVFAHRYPFSEVEHNIEYLEG